MPGDRNISHACFSWCTFLQSWIQREKYCLKRERKSWATWSSHCLRNWWLAGFSPLPMRHLKKRRSALAFFGSWWSSWPPRFTVQKYGRQTCVPSHYSSQTSWHQMKPWWSWHLKTCGSSGMLPQEVWKQRREAGIHGRVPTRKEWDGHRKEHLMTRKRCKSKDGEVRKKAVAIWDESTIVVV